MSSVFCFKCGLPPAILYFPLALPLTSENIHPDENVEYAVVKYPGVRRSNNERNVNHKSRVKPIFRYPRRAVNSRSDKLISLQKQTKKKSTSSHKMAKSDSSRFDKYVSPPRKRKYLRIWSRHLRKRRKKNRGDGRAILRFLLSPFVKKYQRV